MQAQNYSISKVKILNLTFSYLPIVPIKISVLLLSHSTGKLHMEVYEWGWIAGEGKRYVGLTMESNDEDNDIHPTCMHRFSMKMK